MARPPGIMVTNSAASTPNFHAFSNYVTQRPKFLRTGMEIYEFQSQDSLHAKSLCFDSRISVVGTFNLDDRSIYIDTESMLIIDSPLFAAQLEAAILQWKDRSLQVGPDNRYIPDPQVPEAPYPVSRGVLMRISGVFSRLLQFLI